MTKRPLSVTIVSLLIAAAGAVGFVYHLTELNLRHPFQYDVVWISLVRLLAIVGGVYMLLGHNWARWLSMAWIGFHVVISVLHPLRQLAFHSVLFVVFACALFHPKATEYFQTGRVN